MHKQGSETIDINIYISTNWLFNGNTTMMLYKYSFGLILVIYIIYVICTILCVQAIGKAQHLQLHSSS